MSNRSFINNLRMLYSTGNLVPFIGAGLSLPFHVPDWTCLIRDMAVAMDINSRTELSLNNLLEFHLHRYEYWDAVDIFKKYLGRSEQDIQEYIVDKVNSSIDLTIPIDSHNYADLGNMRFGNYVTTNYDHILSKFVKSNLVPVNLIDVNDSTQRILNDSDKVRIFHLHGNISDTKSIVLSKDKYRELYTDNKYKMLFSLFAGTKTFLFMGFSFNDVFIQNIIREHNEYFNNKHYIILSNPSEEQVVYLKETYNIETIKYNPTEQSSHAHEIRKILQQITTTEVQNTAEELAEDFMDGLIDSLPNTIEKRELEKNLFCRKLRLENIDDNKIDYSKECFFTAEQYIRWLKKSGIRNNEKIIRHMLDICYMEYKDILIQFYNIHKDSDMFLQSVHNALSKLQYEHVANILNNYTMPIDINKKGFIHLLADTDDERDVWWGDKRL
jgi:hypothetical protein